MANPTKENKPVKKGLISGLKRFFGGNVDVVENEILEDYKANGFLAMIFIRMAQTLHISKIVHNSTKHCAN